MLKKISITAGVLCILLSNSVSTQPTIEVLAPVEGDTFYLDDTIWIQWTASGLSQDAVYIEYSPDNGVSWPAINTAGIGTQDEDWGNYPWVPNLKCPSNEMYINIGEYEGTYVQYSGRFSFDFHDPTISIIEPSWGASYDPGDTVWIEFCTAQLTADAVKIEYSDDDGGSWTSLVDNLSSSDENWEMYPWTPTFTDDVDRAKLKITTVNDDLTEESSRFKILGSNSPVKFSLVKNQTDFSYSLSGLAFNPINSSLGEMTIEIYTLSGDKIFAGTIESKQSNTIFLPCTGSYIALITNRMVNIIQTIELTAIK